MMVDSRATTAPQRARAAATSGATTIDIFGGCAGSVCNRTPAAEEVRVDSNSRPGRAEPKEAWKLFRSDGYAAAGGG